MKKQWLYTFLFLLCTLLLLSGCGVQNTENELSTDSKSSSAEEEIADVFTTVDIVNAFSERDLDGTWDESEVIDIELNGDTAFCDSAYVIIDGSQICITAEGIYRLSGTLADGQIIIDAPDTDKVQLILSGVDITSNSSAAIYALEADKVFITLAEETQNNLANGGTYEAVDENSPDRHLYRVQPELFRKDQHQGHLPYILPGPLYFQLQKSMQPIHENLYLPAPHFRILRFPFPRWILFPSAAG